MRTWTLPRPVAADRITLAALRLGVAPAFLRDVLTQCGLLTPEMLGVVETPAARSAAHLLAAAALRRRASVLAMDPELALELNDIADQIERRNDRQEPETPVLAVPQGITQQARRLRGGL